LKRKATTNSFILVSRTCS